MTQFLNKLTTLYDSLFGLAIRIWNWSISAPLVAMMIGMTILAFVIRFFRKLRKLF